MRMKNEDSDEFADMSDDYVGGEVGDEDDLTEEESELLWHQSYWDDHDDYNPESQDAYEELLKSEAYEHKLKLHIEMIKARRLKRGI